MGTTVTLNSASVVRPSASQVSSKLGDEVVIMNMADGNYYGLDGAGALVWNRLQEGPRSMGDLCSAVLAEFEVEPEECEQDLIELMSALIAEGIVELVEA
jgi:hypothetical protein